MEDKFVNFEKIEYKSFPFLDGALIYDVEESEMLKLVINALERIRKKSIKLIKKRNKNLIFLCNKSEDEFNNILENDEIFVYISENKYFYYYKYNNNLCIYKNYGNNFYNGIIDNIFKIKYI
jgi:hypothetical protein